MRSTSRNVLGTSLTPSISSTKHSSMACSASAPRSIGVGIPEGNWLQRNMSSGNISITTVVGVLAPLAAAYLFKDVFGLAWTSYCSVLASHPLQTKMATGAVGTFLGDLLAQYIGYIQARDKVKGRNATRAVAAANNGYTPRLRPLPEFSYDVMRAVRFLGWATFIVSPLGHYWFNFLDANVFPATPTAPYAIVAKMACDQLLMTPLLTLAFFMGMKTMEGAPEQAIPTVKEKLWPSLKANWVVWPVLHIINFAFIPTSQRILYCNVMAIFWTAYMSTVLAKNSSVVSMGSIDGSDESAEAIAAAALLEMPQVMWPHYSGMHATPNIDRYVEDLPELEEKPQRPRL